MEHILYRFPGTSADARAQVNRLLSGAGTHAEHPDGPSNWCLKWHGTPRRSLCRRESWIGICLAGYVEGWVRFCHFEQDALSHFGDPAVARRGPVLFVDRYLRLAQPIWYGTSPKRHHYILPSVAEQHGCPGPNGGAPISWVAGGQARSGCVVHGP